MRSAEKSGVDAERFSVRQDQSKNRTDRSDYRRRAHFILSPITAAVALTSVLSAMLFIIYDTARSLDDMKNDLTMIGTAIADDIAELAPEAAATFIGTSPQHFGELAQASLAGSAQPGLLGQTVIAEPHGMLTLEAEPHGLFSGIALRGSIALGLAALLTLLTWRRPNGDMPDMLQRHNYRTLAAAIPMGVACWTKDGALVVCNEQYRQRLDLTSHTVTYHAAVKRLIRGGYMKLLNEDENNRLLELHREDGSYLLIDERPLGDGGFMTLVSDVTERKKTDTLLHAIREEQRQLARRYHEEKLKAEAASHAKTNFLAHLSHDIRTPLNHIIGFAELMRHQTYGPLGDERYSEYVDSIKTSGEHLLASFATILDLAEMESGQKALRTDPVAVDSILDSVVQRFSGQAARAGVTFQLDEPCSAVVQGDRLGLVRMVANIVDNSLRFTPSGGKVTLAAFAARDGVVIEITDTGVGMNEQRLATLSQPFALGDATFTREGIGPGLGISISRAIAELSGGHMAIDSSPSLGTTVAISLPLYHNEILAAA